jgi:hypothetical protein
MELLDAHLKYINIIIPIITALLASSGFWLFLDKTRQTSSLSRRLLIGLAHDRIICLSIEYIERGWVTQDEYENLFKFLYTPYIELGGNGSANRLMVEVDKLPIRNIPLYKGDTNVSDQ